MVSRREGGQSTVELALCLPLLALMIGALAQVGILVLDQTRLWNAAREAARVAVVQPDPRDAEEAARASGLSGVRVDVDPAPPFRRFGDPLTVSLSFRETGGVPLVASLFAGVTLHADATMRIEEP